MKRTWQQFDGFHGGWAVEEDEADVVGLDLIAPLGSA